MNNLKKILYRVTCDIHRLKINKSIEFETKIMWKRHQKKAETQSIKHINGYSIFNEPLVLEFDMPLNPDTGLFESKNTEIVAVITYQGKVKSGGYAKFNISDPLNEHPDQTTKLTIPMTQCPDPSAFIEVSFSYERLGEEQGEASVLNISSQDLEISRIDFKDDKLSMEMERINSMIGKFEKLAITIKEKGKKNQKMPELLSQAQTFEGEKYALLSTIEKLEQQLKAKEDERKRAKQQSEDLEKQLDKKSKELREAKAGEKIKAKENIANYKQLYENALRELEEVRSSEGNLRKSLDLRLAGNLDDVEKIADFDKSHQSDDDNAERLQELTRQNVELQSQVASVSHKLAQLFNASYEFGGAKLLDYLQTSIGLTEINQ